MTCCPHCKQALPSQSRTLRNIEIARRLKSGESVKDAAKGMGVSVSVAYTVAREYGLSMRTSPERIAEAARRALAGESATALARELGVNRRTIYDWKEAHARIEN